jgi:hypothetical protein
MKQKFKMFMVLMCFALISEAHNGTPRWYGNNHFRITQKGDLVYVAMSKMPWESFAVNLTDIISPDGYLSFDIKSQSSVLLRVDGFTADNKQIELFSEQLHAGKFTTLSYNASSSQDKIEHLIIYVNPGEQYRGEVQFRGIRTTRAEQKSTVSVFPNPTAGDVKVQLADKSYTEIVLQDAAGNVVNSKPVVNSEAVMNLTDQKPGIYFIKARGRNSVVTTKIIKQ